MSYSIQTNVASIRAQENLRVNGEFQNRTINRLTSGFRINNSSDDAAGLAVANKFRGDITELNQGVRNANDGISTLEIVDGGLNNISQMLDRLRTLATQSSSASFTGSRQTLNTEYQSLLKEIDRQAANIGLSTGANAGRFAKSIDVYIGGGNGVQSNGQVSVDLNGSRVDSSGLGILNSNILGGSGTNLDATVLNSNTIFLTGGKQDFTFNLAGSNKTVTINGGTSGISGQQAVDQFNQQLTATGISAMIDANGTLQFFGEQTAFTVTAGAVVGAGTAVQTAAGTKSNTNLAVDAATSVNVSAGTGAGETLTFMVGKRSMTVDVSNLANTDAVRDKINSVMNSYGVFAVENQAGTMIKLQGTSDFTYAASSANVFAAAGGATVPTTNSLTQNSLDAISSLTNAVNSLGAVQGKVGTGQNQLNYAMQLAQSQIASFSAAESRIRDTDVAAEAANLTKAQVLQQTSIAAMAQANSAPQSIMALLRG